MSGLNINVDKTKVMWIGSCKNNTTPICPEYNLSWDNSNFIFLGIQFSINLSDMVCINNDKKIEEIKNMLNKWSKRLLSPLGKIIIIKSLALAKLNHLMICIPSPPEQKIACIYLG